VATEHRWTNVGAVLRRFLVLLAADRILVSALTGVKTHWGLSPGLAEILKREIEADQNAFPAKNKLRLLRIVAGFHHPQLVERMVISLVANEVMDRLLFAVLGGPSQPRVTIAVLAHPHQSPLVACQNIIWSLLRNFDDGKADDIPGPRWWLLGRLGCGYDDVNTRLASRKVLLQLSAALTEYFELRMETVPYRLTWLQHEEVTEAAKSEVAEQFFKLQQGCLPLFCRRLRDAFTSPEALKTRAVDIIKCWSEGTFVSIDFSERSHAQFRHAILSQGPAADFSAASDRLLLRQHVAAHVAAGGKDPATTGSIEILREANVDVGDALRRRTGGNAYVEFSNHKRKAYKVLVAAGRALTKQERHDMEEQIKAEWHVIKNDEELVGPWRVAHLLKARERALQVVPAEVATETSQPFVSPCCLSDNPSELVSTQTLVKEMEKRTSRVDAGAAARAHDLERKGKLHVSMPAPCRTQDSAQVKSMFGCFTNRKNFCRVHGLDRDIVVKLEALLNYIKRWVDNLDAERARDCSELVAFIGKNEEDEGAIMVVSLLVLTRRSPKMQFFANCVGAEDASRTLPYPPILPLNVEVADRLPRLSVPGAIHNPRAVCISTSDELALYLLSLRSSWSLAPLKYDVPTATASLLSMVISEVGDEFAARRVPVPARARKVESSMPMEFELGDPVQFGREQATSSSRGPSCSPAAPVADAAGPEDELPGISSDEEEEDVMIAADLEPDIAADIVELLRESRDVPLAAPIEPEVLAADAAAPIVVEDEVEVAAIEDLVAGEDQIEEHVAEVGAPWPLAANPTPIQCAEVAEMDDDGYVSCPLGRFGERGQVGRITMFPKGASLEKLNVSMRCYLHVGCSVTRRRKNCTDAQLLRWLFSGQPFEIGADVDILQRNHNVLAVSMC
jgi:hypothetical protein